MDETDDDDDDDDERDVGDVGDVGFGFGFGSSRARDGNDDRRVVGVEKDAQDDAPMRLVILLNRVVVVVWRARRLVERDDR